MAHSMVSVVGVAAVCALAQFAVAGPEWVERGDAGSTAGVAQPTLGEGVLSSIRGSLGSPDRGAPQDLEDMFLIEIVDPGSFTMEVTSAAFDPQLFVFNITLPGEGFGLLANDNTLAGMLPFMSNVSTDGSGAMINLPGIYAVAISGAGRNPISNNGLIFNLADPTEVSGPDGPGGFLPHNDWTGDGQTGNYLIELNGSEFYDVPAPGAAALLLLAVGIFGSRRRRC